MSIVSQYLPLSENQRGLWHLQTIHPELTAYNTSSVFRVRSTLALQSLQHALHNLVMQQPLLRTTFMLQGDTPYQVIHEWLNPVFEQIMLPAATEIELGIRVQAAHERPFDLTTGPLVRLTIFTHAADDHVLLLSFHHILLDFYTQTKLTKRLFDLYVAEASDEPLFVSNCDIEGNYDDFVTWQQSHLAGPKAVNLRDYWSEQLQAPLPILDLPTDRPLPREQTFNGSTYRFRLSAPLSQDIIALAGQQQATPFAFVLTAFALLLARYSRQDDLIVGIATDERARAPRRFQQTLGHMINLLPIRVTLADQPTFVDLLQRVQTAVMGGLWHQHYPFAHMVQDADWVRDSSRSPLFDLAFNMPVSVKSSDFATLMEGTPTEPVMYKGLQLEPYDLCQQAAQNFLSLDLWPTDDGMVGFLKYNTDLFDEATIARMAGHFEVLLKGIVAAPVLPVLHLPMLTTAEYHQIVHEWNDTAVDFGPPQTIHALFEQQVARTPNATAVVSGSRFLVQSGKSHAETSTLAPETLTYAELNARANQLAHHLMALGVQADTLVAVALERSLDTVVSLLAVLKAGGAYVPIDTTYPSERIRFMLTNSAAPILLTQSHLPLAQEATQQIQHLLLVDTMGAQLAHQPTGNPQTTTAPADLAYVIYTSGSTGKPKGIAIPHANVANFLLSMQQQPGLLPTDRLLALTTISFDIAVLELYLPLVVGAVVVIASADNGADPAALLRLIHHHQITIVQATPATWTMLTAHPAWSDTPPLKVLCGGEAFPFPLAQHLLEHSQSVWNMYGPTEATVWVSGGQVKRGLQQIAIAPPIANTTFYILDEVQCIVPIGVAGELYIGGVQLARGYLNRPDLTAERFINHPEFGRLYKTGDLCRWRPALNGLPNIEFLGRTDFQVKIRGFRIELGEIESALLAQEGIREAVVVAWEDNPGDKRLVAYLVGEADTDTLRQQLAQRLPEYMIPSAFVNLDAMPFTPNGKLDRRALPAPDYTDLQREFVAPRNAQEAQLAAIWGEVLGLAQVGVYDNFFVLGGHSLLATQVVSRLRAQLNLAVPLKTLFEAAQLGTFAQRIQQSQASAEGLPAPRIQAAARSGRLPLSFAQQRLWFLDQLEPNSAFYNIPMLTRLVGALDVAALEASFAYLIQRHESLRTTFETLDDQPIQVIHASAPFRLTVVTVENEAQAQTLAAQEAITPFNLRSGPLVRVQLLRLNDASHWLALTLHHSISDGWSTGVLAKELNHAYRAYTQGVQPSLPDLPIQYADFAVWQRAYLQGDILDRQLSFWRTHLSGAPALLELPTDYPRPPVQSYRGAHYPFHLDADLAAKLKQLAQNHEASLFMLLLAAFNVLLARYSRQTDIVVGTPVANRNHAEIEGLIGFFVNTLVLRTQLEDNPSFSALLESVRQTTLAAYEQQDLPFEQLVDALQPERTLSYSPLFQVMLVLQNADAGTFDLPHLTVTEQAIAFPFAKFDLTLYLMEQEKEGGLLSMLEYNTDLFDESTIARLAAHFEVLLKGIVAHPEQAVHQLPMLSADEYHQIVHEWNDTAVDFGEPQTIHALFEQQVEMTPDAIALIFADEQLTYSELNARANQLAHHLIGLGVAADTLVAVALERSLEMVISLLAVFKAGGAYVPIDPTYPAERIAYMLADSIAPILLTQSHLALAQTAAQQIQHVILVDTMGAQLANHPIGNLQTAPADLAYVIYTSGSTGQPKGVMVEHVALATHIQTTKETYGISPADRILQFASISFDVSLEQIFLALCSGAALVVRGKELWTGAEFDRHLLTHHVTVADLPPAYLHQLLQHWQTTFPTFLAGQLRLMLVGGEKIMPETVNLWQQLPISTTRLLNAYGPTETTITATCFDLSDYDVAATLMANIPIGQPLANRRLYVLDAHCQPTPIGVAGELYIGGRQLARGYLNRPELTAERFINHPDFGRLYKTGDLCRWLPDGNIEYLGRTDFQVKIRGFRIELGEIENALLAQESVREAVVLAREDVPGDKRLVAYLVGEADTDTLRQQLAQRLPEYMLPAAFVNLDVMPQTPNGKLDQRALPAPDYTDLQREFVAPRNVQEAQLAAIWGEVLGLAQVGVYDNFFALGGHSLLAVQLIGHIRTALQIDLPLRELFSTPTIAGVAEAIGNRVPTQLRPTIQPISRALDLPLSLIQEDVWRRSQTAAFRGQFDNFSCSRLTGALDVATLCQSFNVLLTRHEALRTIFPLVNERPVQLVVPAAPIDLPLVDLSAQTAAEQARAVAALIETEKQRPLDLLHGPLWRPSLVRLAPTEHLLLLSMHHILGDNSSGAIIFNELATLYTGFIRGIPATLPPLTIQYADYAYWQRHFFTPDVLAERQQYWQALLTPQPPLLCLPTDHPRPAEKGEQSHPAANAPFVFPLDLSQQVAHFSRNANVTPFMTLLAAYSLLLYRYSQSDDFMVGSVTSRRDDPTLAPVIGHFASMSWLRINLRGMPCFTELLERVSTVSLDAIAHQDINLRQLLQATDSDWLPGPFPHFRAVIDFLPPAQKVVEFSGLTLTETPNDRRRIVADVALFIWQEPQATGDPLLKGFWSYRQDLFEPATIDRLNQHFQALLQVVLADPTQAIEAYPYEMSNIGAH